MRVQHRRLDLDEAALGEERAHRGDRGEADREHPARLVVGDEVDVALAEPRVDVGEAVPLLGQAAATTWRAA